MPRGRSYPCRSSFFLYMIGSSTQAFGLSSSLNSERLLHAGIQLGIMLAQSKIYVQLGTRNLLIQGDLKQHPLNLYA
uniref:Uncharacterized protein n=1 Tax=Arundo donax TaxID=35708 RepID=A0A0A9AX56_ARUDO